MAQTLTTPVVSVATPSLLAQGLPFSAMPTAYNTGEINTQALGVKKTFWLREKAILIFFLILDIFFYLNGLVKIEQSQNKFITGQY